MKMNENQNHSDIPPVEQLLWEKLKLTIDSKEKKESLHNVDENLI